MTKIDLSDKKVVMIVAPKGFRDEELFDSKKVLENYGAGTLVASLDYGQAEGMLAGRVNIDLTLTEIEVTSCDGVVFIGGQGAATYFENETALQIAKEAYEQGKVLGAICVAPMILANAGVLKGKRATSFDSLEGKLRGMGVDYVTDGVVVDGKIITARGPKDAANFGEKIAQALMSENS